MKWKNDFSCVMPFLSGLNCIDIYGMHKTLQVKYKAAEMNSNISPSTGSGY